MLGYIRKLSLIMRLYPSTKKCILQGIRIVMPSFSLFSSTRPSDLTSQTKWGANNFFILRQRINRLTLSEKGSLLPGLHPVEPNPARPLFSSSFGPAEFWPFAMRVTHVPITSITTRTTIKILMMHLFKRESVKEKVMEC